MVVLLKKYLSRGNYKSSSSSENLYSSALGSTGTQSTRNVLSLIIALSIMPVMASCSMPQADPKQQTIPTDSNQWQKKLGDTFEQLPESDRQLLSRYMLRMKLMSQGRCHVLLSSKP
ncbi:hypothetical protein [Psychrobacter frigidicola]|uniref:hypothetical protein n=1 Tax=Psychrobacter frigidicola TaxID=45611 RepID=UPI001D10BF3D|nr:hypothetical protein [Psychrobacter frigidicola]